MRNTSRYDLLQANNFGSNNWCLNFQPLYNHALLTSLSNGEVHHLDWNTGKTKQVVEIGDTSCNKLKIIDSNFHNGTLYSVASSDSVKIFDIRSKNSIKTLKNEKNVPFLSLDSRHGLLACGTELCGVDAEIQIYDIKKWEQPARTLVESHHDDITDLKFHPSDPRLLLSGSTDGYTNIYDLTQDDEEDALHQVINFASIHSCGWLSPKRIFTLSHMETFAIHELNDRTDKPKEPEPLEFGDVREPWGCSYIIDVYPGFIAAGNSQENSGALRLLPFENEQVDVEASILIPSAHGDEVIRDVFVHPLRSNLLYTCGEDGYVKMWRTQEALKVPASFWDYSQESNVLGNPMSASSQESSEEMESNYKLSESQPTTSEERRDKKMKAKKKSRSRATRYKPY